MSKKKTSTKKKPVNNTIQLFNEYASGKFLVIVESPSKTSKIEQYLGEGYQVIASKGHITQIDGLKSIDTKNGYKVKFSISPSKAAHVKYMREIIDQYLHENIIIATDNDREGEAIGFHLCCVFDLPMESTKRIIFNEITQDAILTAVRSPTLLNQNLIRSQNARQILDMMIGYKVSPMLWKYVYHSKSNSLSAGRCQTPALRLIYDNYQEGIIKQTNGSNLKYKTTGYFFPPHNLPCELNHEFEDPMCVRAFLEASHTFHHTFLVQPKTTITKNPPQPLNTSRLLQTAGGLLHLSPKVIMQLAQRLYQDGHITYMRTESKKYSQAFLVQTEKYILQKFKPVGGILPPDQCNKKYIGEFAAISNEGLNLPHEAIRVTHVETSHLSTDDNKLNALYHYIWKITVESCMSPATYDSYKIVIQGAQDHHFTHVLEIPVFLGWKRLEMSDAEVTELQSKGQGLLMYVRNLPGNVKYNHMVATAGYRGLHSHYTESGLIQKLEELGIGRPSTYALFIDTIQERGYVTKKDVEGKAVNCSDFTLRMEKGVEECVSEKVFGNEHNKLVIQPLGILCIEFLVSNFGKLFDYSYTKYLEEELDKVAYSDRLPSDVSRNMREHPVSQEVVSDSKLDGFDQGEYSSGKPTEYYEGSYGAKPLRIFLESSSKWYTICDKTQRDIAEMTKALTTLKKETYPMDDRHELIFHAFGPCIRKCGCEDASGVWTEDLVEFLPIKKSMQSNLDLKKLKCGEYALDELVIFKQSYLGMYQDSGVFLRNGPYGPYIEWNDTKKTTTEDRIGSLTYEDALQLITEETATETPDSKFLRALTVEMSVRTGKYGPYVYYKTTTMKMPKFVNIKTFPQDALTCDSNVLISWVLDEVKKPKASRGGGRGGGGRYGRGRGRS